MLVDIVADRHDQLLDTAEDSAADSVLSDVAKEPLHHVEPRTAGRSEVDVESGMTNQPPLREPRRGGSFSPQSGIRSMRAPMLTLR